MAQEFGTTQGFGTTPAQGPTTGAAREWTLAVDFGTSNTAAAHTNPLGGAVETLQLSHTGATMPSAVFVASPEEIVVGDHARDRAESYPPGYVPSPKRALGQGVVQVAGYEVPAARLVAAVLRAVLERACAAQGGSAPTRLVLTHPEAWLPREVQVLTDAAGLLGLPSSTEVTTVSEPRAAARYYAGGRGLEPGRLVAVFDFGGGTLDVAVLRADDAGDVEVVAARGDNGLGGRTLDAAVRGWVDRQLEDSDPDRLEWLRTAAPMEAHLALDTSIRRAKELLSETSSATIAVPGVSDRAHLQLTRGEFQELVAGPLDAAVALTSATLADAGAGEPGALEAIYLTGGSSRIPAVHERLARLGPVATLDDPKTVVARGAITATDADPFAGLAAAPGTRPMPAFGEAPAHGHGGDVVPGDAGRPSGSRRRVPMVAAAVAAAVVLLGGGLGAWALLGPKGDEQPAPAGTSGDAGGAGGAAGASAGAAADPVVGKEAVLAALPPELTAAFTRCKISGETDAGGTEVQCALDSSSPAAQGIAGNGLGSATVSVDRSGARKELASIRSHTHDDRAVPTNELVENAERTAAATYTGPSGSSGFKVFYANTDTGVTVWMFDLADLAGAKQFMARTGLLTG